MVEQCQHLTLCIGQCLRFSRKHSRRNLIGARERKLVRHHPRLDLTNERVGLVETTLRDLAEQQRFVVRHLSALTTRDRRLETEVDDLRGRVDAIEKRLPG